MNSIPLLIGVLLASVLVGAVPALVNALKPGLQQLLNLDPERVERLERMQFFLAWIAGMPLAGYLADAWNPYNTLIAGCIGISFTVAFLGVTETPTWLGAISFLLGIATSFLVVGTLLLAPAAIHAPGNCPGGALNAAFVAICIGSFMPGVVLQLFERWFGPRRGLMLLGLGALLPAIFLFITLADETPEVLRRDPAASATSFFSDLRFWLAVAMLLLYYPIESALDIWSEPFLHELGYQDRSRRMVVGFWIAFILARLAMWYLLSTRNEIWLLGFCTFTSAIVLGNLVGAYGASSGGFGFFLVGASYGPLLPGFLGLVLEVCPQTPGLALGSVLGLAGLHDALAQPVMRRGTKNRAVRISMRIPLVMTLLMLVPLLVLGLIRFR